MGPRRAPKISLGFVIRRCTLALGHRPNARELSEWANTAGEQGMAIFGRPIGVKEAEVILRHQGREVSTHRLQPHGVECGEDGVEAPVDAADAPERRGPNVVDFAAARDRRRRG